MERLGGNDDFTITIDFNAATFISLQEVCYQYWPADDTKGMEKYGEFSVSVLQATKQNGFIQRNISINNPKVMDKSGRLIMKSGLV